MAKTLFIKRREYVNNQFKRLTLGKHITNKKKTKLLKKLWKEAKIKFK